MPKEVVYRGEVEMLRVLDTEGRLDEALVDGSLTDGARVSDLYLFDGDTKVNAEEVGKSRRISSLLLLLDSGTRLAVICTEAQLTLGGGGKRLKDWEGPLGG